jgi:hypothetical protein
MSAEGESLHIEAFDAPTRISRKATAPGTLAVV